MYEMGLGTVAATNMNIDQHLNEVTKPLQIWEEVKRHINNGCDPFNSHLPPEIISHIFAIYVAEFNSNLDLQCSSTEHGGPLLLGAVSKLWREVAFGTPQLWSTINIHILSLTNDITPKIELTKE